jgi:ribosomal protein S11
MRKNNKKIISNSTLLNNKKKGTEAWVNTRCKENGLRRRFKIFKLVRKLDFIQKKRIAALKDVNGFLSNTKIKKPSSLFLRKRLKPRVLNYRRALHFRYRTTRIKRLEKFNKLYKFVKLRVRRRIKWRKFIESSKFGDRQNLINKKGGWYFTHKQRGKPLPPYKVREFYAKSKIARNLVARYSFAHHVKRITSHTRFKRIRIGIMKAAWRYYRLLMIARRGRKRPKKIKKLPTITFYRTVNNLFYALRDRSGKIFHASSIGTFGLKGKKRYEPFGMRKVANDMIARFKLLKIYKVHVVCRSSIRKGVRSILWYFQKTGMKVERIIDYIRTPHGNVRLPARRRMKRRRR